MWDIRGECGTGGARRRPCLVVVLAGLLLVLAAPGRANDAGRAVATSDEQIAQAVIDLGHASWRRREAAGELLARAGRSAKAALMQAARSDDPEVAVRARLLLDRLRYGVFADMPRDVAACVIRYRLIQPTDERQPPGLNNRLPWQDARLQVIGELMQTDAGLEAVLSLMISESDEKLRDLIRDRVGNTLGRVHEWIVRSEERAQRVLRGVMCGDSEKAMRDFACFALAYDRVDAEIAQIGDPADADEAALLAYLHRAKGDLPSARQAAAKVSPRFEALIAVEQGDWAAAEKLVGPTGLLTGTGRETSKLGITLAMARLNGRAEEADRLAATLAELATRSETEARAAAGVLLANGRIEQGVAALRRAGDRDSLQNAMEILIAQDRIDEALALADEAPAEPFAAPGRAIGLLHELGRTDEAVRRLYALPRPPDDKAGNLRGYWIGLVGHEARMGRLDDARGHALEGMKAIKDHEALMRALVQDCQEFPAAAHARHWLGGAWLTQLRRSCPDITDEDAVGHVFELLGGRPDRGRMHEKLDALTQRVGDQADGQYHALAARTLHAAGFLDLAAPYWAAARGIAEHSYHGPTAHLAHCNLAVGRFDEAAKLYGSQTESGHNIPLIYLHGYALAKAGQVENGRATVRFAQAIACHAPNGYRELIDVLARADLPDEVRRHRIIQRRIAPFPAHVAGDLSDAAIDRPLDLVLYYEVARLWSLQSGFGFGGLKSVELACRLHEARMRALLEAGDVEAARAELDACLRLLPGDVASVAAMVAFLDKADRPADADAVFARAAEHHLNLIEQYPGCERFAARLTELRQACGRQ